MEFQFKWKVTRSIVNQIQMDKACHLIRKILSCFTIFLNDQMSRERPIENVFHPPWTVFYPTWTEANRECFPSYLGDGGEESVKFLCRTL